MIITWIRTFWFNFGHLSDPNTTIVALLCLTDNLNIHPLTPIPNTKEHLISWIRFDDIGFTLSMMKIIEHEVEGYFCEGK